MSLQLWTQTVASTRRAAEFAKRAEGDGWAGISVVDSQNLSGDVYVTLALAASATERLGVATGVTNPITRHPAVTASAIASIQNLSRGRATLAIGRGDSALAHLGRAPTSVARFESYLTAVQRYLRGEEIPFDELDFQERAAPPVADLELHDTPDVSRLHGLSKRDTKVPVEAAATGPRVIAAAARRADRVLFAVGADPKRLTWAIDEARRARSEAGLDPDQLAFGAYVNLVCHSKLEVARSLVSGGLATFARFSVMHGHSAGPIDAEQRKVLGGIHSAYDMKHHTRTDSQHAAVLTPEFIDQFSIVGDPDHCRDRLEEIVALGIDKLILVGPTAGADRDEALISGEMLTKHILSVYAQ